MKRTDLWRLNALRLRHRLNRRFPRTIRVRVPGASPVAFHATGPRDRYDVTSLGNEVHFVTELLNRLEESDVVYDVGAHLGLIALLAAPRVKEVVAFEPDSVLSDKLLESASLNDFDNVRLERLAVGDRLGTVTLWSRGPGRGSPALTPRPGYQGTEVPMVTMDSYISDGTAREPSVVKIDVEGHEDAVFAGMKETLEGANKPRLLAVEIHPGGLRRHGSSKERLTQDIEAYGYRRVWTRPRGRQEHVIWQRA